MQFLYCEVSSSTFRSAKENAPEISSRPPRRTESIIHTFKKRKRITIHGLLSMLFPHLTPYPCLLGTQEGRRDATPFVIYHMPPSASTTHNLARSLVKPSRKIRNTSSALVE